MSITESTIAHGRSHGKLILVGEHSVVYGKPAIALPFPLEVRVKIEAFDGCIQIDSDLYKGDIHGAPSSLKGLEVSINGLLRSLGKEAKGISITIDSDIPIGRGMGSSAAVAIAVLRCIDNYYGQEATEDMLFRWVALAESYAHGNASGIDMTTAAGNAAIWFERDHGMEAIDIQVPLYMAVADTGEKGDTRMAVHQVQERYLSSRQQIQNILDTMGELAGKTKESLKTGDLILLGQMMDLNHGALRDLGLSSDKIERLIQRAKTQGALGAKLTGGGLGGCVIALANNMSSAQKIAGAFMDGGAVKSWYFSSHHNELTTLGSQVKQP